MADYDLGVTAAALHVRGLPCLCCPCAVEFRSHIYLLTHSLNTGDYARKISLGGYCKKMLPKQETVRLHSFHATLWSDRFS